jgi:hypothetical protein
MPYGWVLMEHGGSGIRDLVHVFLDWPRPRGVHPSEVSIGIKCRVARAQKSQSQLISGLRPKKMTIFGPDAKLSIRATVTRGRVA